MDFPSFNIPSKLDDNLWMISLTTVEVYKSIFTIEKINIVEIYIFKEHRGL